MKRFALILLALALAVPVLAGEHPEAAKTAWFDMENCDFCKNLTGEPGLMEHLTWENHVIDAGAMVISTVDAKYAEAYEKANHEMHALGEKMMAGKVDPTSVKMCGHCSMMGQLMMAGAKMEMVKGEQANVDVTLITSDDPAIVKKIHKFTERNIDEMKKMMAASDHSGHDHPQGKH